MPPQRRMGRSAGPSSPRRKNTDPDGPQRRRAGGGARPPRRSRRNLRWKYAAVLLLTWLAIAAGITLLYFMHDLPDTSKLGETQKQPSIVLTDSEGLILATYGDLYGKYLRYNEIPPQIVKALLATEDRRFFGHFGVDPIGITRAMVRNYQAGKLVEGGSTLTQQLAKNLFLSPARTLKRKFQEALLALWLEYKFTKEQILELYLNRVYLGAGTYGIDAAAYRYFGKSVTELSMPESAMLVGLLKAPSRFSPTSDMERAETRMKEVLQNMVEAEFIDARTAENAAKTPIKLETYRQEHSQNAYYFGDWVLEQIPDYLTRAGRDIVVRSTLNPKLQAASEEALETLLEKEGAEKKVSQGAVVTLAEDGAVKALVGGRNYLQSQYNRVTQAKRQPGSSFKMFVYLTALEQGYSPYSLMEDRPISIGGWSPENYTGKYLGTVTLQTALAQSLNTVTAQLAQQVGQGNINQMAQRLGIESPLQNNLSTSLGASEVTLLELTRAFAALPHDGRRVEPYGIIAIEDSDKHVLYQHEAEEEGEQAISPSLAQNITRMLMSVVAEGTGRAANLPERQEAGKTGTSSDYRDALFVGYTADFTTGIWMGNDNNAAMAKVTGGGLPARLWQQVMAAAHQGMPPKPLVHYSVFDQLQGGQAPSGDPQLQRMRLPGEPQPQPQQPSFWNQLFGGFGSGGNPPQAPVQYEYPRPGRN